MSLGYSADLAYIHHVGYGSFARDAAPGVLEIFRRYDISHGLVVDLGCGSGLSARELTKAGFDVLGIDISAPMIRLARKTAPQARFRTASYLNAKLPKCDAITSLGECLAYLFDKDNGPDQLGQLFGRVYDALRPGGVFIFDVPEPGFVQARRAARGHGEGQDWAVFVDISEDTAKRVLTRRITSFRKVGRLYRRHSEIHRLRLYKSTELARELRDARFKVRIVRGYGDLRFKTAHVGFIARKPPASPH